MVVRWVAIISVSHIPCYPLLTYRPLLAHWASHVHYNISFLLSYSRFHTRIGALWCMHALFGSLMSLGPTGASFSHYFSYHHTIAFHHISLVVLFISFFVSFSTCSASSFLHPEWWSFSVHYMEYSHIISTIYPTDTDSKILSLRRSSCQREFLLP